MENFLVITQDLKVSGTSQGIIERSFLAKLRKAYPTSVIDILYLSNLSYEENLEILPVNSITIKKINYNIPFHIKWINRFTRRFFNYLYAENYIHAQFAKEIKKVKYSDYDHVMVRSAGLGHETILAMHNLPILKHSIINFHDPYPHIWYKGLDSKINNNQLKRLHKMIQVAAQAKSCCTSAYYMSKDLQYLYASSKFFYTIPHQFSFDAFDLSDKIAVRKKSKKIQISYHGALMFGRNIFNIIEAFMQLLSENDWIKQDVEFVLRVKGDDVEKLKDIVQTCENIFVMDTLNFSNSSNEQMYESDINIILENGPYYSNILGGKVPFLFALQKKIFISSPARSELRRHLGDYPFLCDMNDLSDIKLKLLAVLTSDNLTSDIGKRLFSDESFKRQLDAVLLS